MFFRKLIVIVFVLLAFAQPDARAQAPELPPQPTRVLVARGGQLVSVGTPLEAFEFGDASIWFRTGEAAIFPEYSINNLQLERLANCIEHLNTYIDSVTIVAFSPQERREGSSGAFSSGALSTAAGTLSQRRASALHQYLLETWPAVDFGSVREVAMVAVPAAKAGDETWLDNTATVVFHYRHTTSASDGASRHTAIAVPFESLETGETIVSAQASTKSDAARLIPLAAFSTNLLFDAVTAVNVAMEFPIARQLTFRIEGIFPWWTWNNDSNAFQVNHLNLGTRYWFGGNVFKGWYGTLGVGAGRFDIEPKKKGWRGWEGMLSVGGGYSVPVSDHVFFDFGLGLGPMLTRFDKYEEVAPGMRSVTDPDKRYLILGPTDLHISIIYLFTRTAR